MFNKKGMLARDYVIMLILFSLFVGLAGLIVYDMADVNNGYNVSGMTDGTFDSTYNKLDVVGGNVTAMADASSSKEGLSILGSVETFFGSTITVIQLLFGSFGIVNGVMASFVSTFGIPLPIANLIFPAILAILTTIIVFVVVSSLTKTKM